VQKDGVIVSRRLTEGAIYKILEYEELPRVAHSQGPREFWPERYKQMWCDGHCRHTISSINTIAARAWWECCLG
jgi:hypothetical protein